MLLYQVNAFDDRHGLLGNDFEYAAPAFPFLAGDDLNEVVLLDVEH